MKFPYFWILFVSCTFSRVLCSGGQVPRRTNEIYPREQAASSAPSHGRSLSVGREGRRLFGRHVCTQNKVKMLPMKEVQSYCKPGYQSYLRRCDKDNSRYCSGYRVVYELAYRTVQRVIAKTESLYTCCPGWTQARVSASDCKKAICREACHNGGNCTKPDHCSCASGWSGKTCKIDIDECSKRKDLCDHECINTPGSYKCVCKGGFTLQADGRNCERKIPEKEITRVERHLDEEFLKKMELLQKRIDALEEWQRNSSSEEKDDDSRHQRDYRINSLSEQIALLEEKLEECSCNKRENHSFPRL